MEEKVENEKRLNHHLKVRNEQLRRSMLKKMKNIQKFKKIGEMFYLWKHQVKISKNRKIVQKVVEKKAELKKKSMFLMGLLKHKQKSLITKKVKIKVKNHEKIHQQLVSKLKFEIYR